MLVNLFAYAMLFCPANQTIIAVGASGALVRIWSVLRALSSCRSTPPEGCVRALSISAHCTASFYYGGASLVLYPKCL